MHTMTLCVWEYPLHLITSKKMSLISHILLPVNNFPLGPTATLPTGLLVTSW